MEMQHHRHLAFLQQPSSESPSYSAAIADPADFDEIIAGVSLQSLLLGEPVLVTPPPPPFPPSPAPTTMTVFAQPLQHYDNRPLQQQQADHHLLHPPAFFFQADVTEKQHQQHQQLKWRRPVRSTSNREAPPRRQRLKVSDKLKALRRIVPCDKKADIATMLEQAYRYVRFLEAQVLALLTMQLFRTPDDHHEDRALCFGDDVNNEKERRMIEAVGRLRRQEVVEAVVNSGTAQRLMYEEGMCLVSEEQVRVLGWVTLQKQRQRQLSGLICNDLHNNNNNNTCCSYSN